MVGWNGVRVGVAVVDAIIVIRVARIPIHVYVRSIAGIARAHTVALLVHRRRSRWRYRHVPRQGRDATRVIALLMMVLVLRYTQEPLVPSSTLVRIVSRFARQPWHLAPRTILVRPVGPALAIAARPITCLGIRKVLHPLLLLLLRLLILVALRRQSMRREVKRRSDRRVLHARLAVRKW